MTEFDKNGQYIRKQHVRPPTILFRPFDTDSEKELEIANKMFVTTRNRNRISGGNLVIGRYSVLPFYKELEDDLATNGSVLINSFAQHQYVADLQNYVYDLGDLTPRTWHSRDIAYLPLDKSFVLKGETNSKKHLWNTHMFAKDAKAAIDVLINLTHDSLIGSQNIYIREYVPLVKLLDNSLGPPVTLEFRFFVAYGKILSGGFYWSGNVDELETAPSIQEVPEEFLKKVIDKVKDKINFFVVDVAKTLSGDWIVVELNDGQMSGLSENDPKVLYKNLKDTTWNSLIK
jgi:hypothetical protein